MLDAYRNFLTKMGLSSQLPELDGPATERAVRAWQSANGVPSTGYFGPKSRNAFGLSGSSSSGAGTSSSSTSAAVGQFLRALALGSTGDDVSSLKTFRKNMALPRAEFPDTEESGRKQGRN